MTRIEILREVYDLRKQIKELQDKAAKLQKRIPCGNYALGDGLNATVSQGAVRMSYDTAKLRRYVPADTLSRCERYTSTKPRLTFKQLKEKA